MVAEGKPDNVLKDRRRRCVKQWLNFNYKNLLDRLDLNFFIYKISMKTVGMGYG